MTAPWPSSQALLLLSILVACRPVPAADGPRSVQRSSNPGESLQEKRAFVERYVTFRRNYHALDYAISHHNNSNGCLPGPSDTDITLIAKVPLSELPQWTAGLSPAPHRPDSAPNLPSSIATDGVTAWFEGPSKVVGIDPQRGIVVYNIWSH